MKTTSNRVRRLTWTLAGCAGLFGCGETRSRALPAPSQAGTTASEGVDGKPVDRFADLRARSGEMPDVAAAEPRGRRTAPRPDVRADSGRLTAPAATTATDAPGATDRTDEPGAAPVAEAGPGQAAPGDDARFGESVAVVEVVLPVDQRAFVRCCLPVPDGFTLPVGDAAAALTPLALRTPDGVLVPCQVEVLMRGPAGQIEVVELIAPVTVARDSVPRSTLQGPGKRRSDPEAAASGGEDSGLSARVALPVHLGEFPLPSARGLDANVEAWLAGGPCVVRTHDVLGNEYRGDLLRPLGGGLGARGPYLRRIEAATVMRPVDADPATGALPHLFGLHGYFALFEGDPRVALDLRVHAGVTSGIAPDTSDDVPVGGIWFDQLDLELPAAWTCDAQFPDSYFGEERIEEGRSRRAFVAHLPGSVVHFMPPSGQFQRRLVLRTRDARGGHPAWEALGFPVEGAGRWSWHAAETARYFPQRVALPTWAALDGARPGGLTGLRAHLVAARDALKTLMRNGSADGRRVHTPAMGWCHPWYYAYEGVTSGDEIGFVDGHLAAAARERAHLEWIAMVHQMNVARQPVALWLKDGRPAGLEAWCDATGRLSIEFYTNANMQPPELRLPCRGGAAPGAHLADVERQSRRPPYDLGEPFKLRGNVPRVDSVVTTWMPHDGQHMVRFTKYAKALVWLAADRLAMGDVRLEAERFRMMVHDAKPFTEQWGMSLWHLEGAAQARPHTGLTINRDHAWGIDSVVSTYGFSDDAWRARFRPWCERFTDVLLAGAMPNGIIQRFHHEQILGGRFDAAMSYQLAFLLHARRVLVEGVFRGVDEARAEGLCASFFAAVEYLYWGPPFQRVEDRWAPGHLSAGPTAQFAVAPRTAEGGESQELPYCFEERWGPGYLPPEGRVPDLVETYYPWDILTYADEWAREAGRSDAGRYLERALILGESVATHGARVERMRLADGRTDLLTSGNHAAYLARVQALGERGALERRSTEGR